MFDSFILLLVEQNDNTYKRKLTTIIKFIKKYAYILNVKNQSIAYTDHRPFIRFLNIKYHKDIFLR